MAHIELASCSFLSWSDDEGEEHGEVLSVCGGQEEEDSALEWSFQGVSRDGQQERAVVVIEDGEVAGEFPEVVGDGEEADGVGAEGEGVLVGFDEEFRVGGGAIGVDDLWGVEEGGIVLEFAVDGEPEHGGGVGFKVPAFRVGRARAEAVRGAIIGAGSGGAGVRNESEGDDGASVAVVGDDEE